MRPVTTMVQQTQYVPYTTYRPVYSAGYVAPQVVQYAPAPQVVQYAPQVVQYAPQVVQYAPAPAPAPACCGSAAPAVYSAPAAAAPAMPAPALQSAPSPSDAPQYDPNNPPTNSPDVHLKPVPEDPMLQYKAAPAATMAPPRANTEIDARTAARPTTGAYRPYAAPAQVRPVAATNNDWRQSAR